MDEELQRCVTALEMRMRGVVCEALPRPLKDKMRYGLGYLSPYELNGREPISVSGANRDIVKQNVERIINASPEGSRFIICCTWDRMNGHVFNAIKTANEIIFLDGQCNEIVGDKYFNKLSPKTLNTIIRVDDLKLNKNVLNCAKRRKENDG